MKVTIEVNEDDISDELTKSLLKKIERLEIELQVEKDIATTYHTQLRQTVALHFSKLFFGDRKGMNKDELCEWLSKNKVEDFDKLERIKK